MDDGRSKPVQANPKQRLASDYLRVIPNRYPALFRAEKGVDGREEWRFTLVTPLSVRVGLHVVIR